ncbi:hypothetical protein VOLCADRAFT_120444 [Volvox carteri f. nagariensis]|uniref:BRISC and BRCA1-A complex member 1 n=1 Tax=Volvox carteri f. nagariensis TaxID=3068 RepID=D8TLL4_VOLCA|nr:uncharacterized protein VOLCADRAFT_120444 [Volvox carteri f. nagariensis]EFJ51895.1 hypothetical protein VOLCADRAFT_120444 [Volvox carteri f. nagariensis]|eukprot:XP_002947305.1 hypothetical protein VOLCADRAFT_120444 [Volvox carteri f. nagariensis]
MPPPQSYHPETVVFVLDACEDPGLDHAKHPSRLDLLKQCIGNCALAKSRVNPSHKFGLAVVRDSVQWEGAGVTTSAEGLLVALRGVHPTSSPPGALAAAVGPPPLDLGSVVSLVQPLAVAEEADGCRVRVVLVYCRSSVLPVWTTRQRPGEALCMDVIFVHDKAAAAAVAATRPDCASPQTVYTWLEDNVDELSARCGHHAYIFEAGCHLLRKVTNLMISLMAHPTQRPPQRALRAGPLDLATVPPQPTSATTASNTASAGVTVISSSAFTAPPPMDAASNEHVHTREEADGSPAPPHWSPGAAVAPGGDVVLEATSQALTGLVLRRQQPPQPPQPPPPSAAPPGLMEGTTVVDPWAAPPPPPVAAPGPF